MSLERRKEIPHATPEQASKLETKLREISAENNKLWLQFRAVVNAIGHLQEKVKVGFDELVNDNAGKSERLLNDVDQTLFAGASERPMEVADIGVVAMNHALKEDPAAIDDPTTRVSLQLEVVERRWERNARVLVEVDTTMPIHEEILARVASLKARFPEELSATVGYQEAVQILDELEASVSAIVNEEDRVARLSGEEQITQEQLDLLNLQTRCEDMFRAIHSATVALDTLSRQRRLSVEAEGETEEVSEEPAEESEEISESDQALVSERFTRVGDQYQRGAWERQEKDLRDSIFTAVNQLREFVRENNYGGMDDEAALLTQMYGRTDGPLASLASNAHLLNDLGRDLGSARRRLDQMRSTRKALHEKRKLRSALAQKIQELEKRAPAPKKRKRRSGAR